MHPVWVVQKHFSQNNGRLYFEIGYDQAAEVSDLMEQAGFTDIHTVKDYAGLDRVVYGRKMREVDNV